MLRCGACPTAVETTARAVSRVWPRGSTEGQLSITLIGLWIPVLPGLFRILCLHDVADSVDQLPAQSRRPIGPRVLKLRDDGPRLRVVRRESPHCDDVGTVTTRALLKLIPECRQRDEPRLVQRVAPGTTAWKERGRHRARNPGSLQFMRPELGGAHECTRFSSGGGHGDSHRARIRPAHEVVVRLSLVRACGRFPPDALLWVARARPFRFRSPGSGRIRIDPGSAADRTVARYGLPSRPISRRS